MLERRKPDRVVVLAAGTGSRLVSAESVPKPLKPVRGVPLLVRILRCLQDEGICEAIVITGHQGDQIRRELLAEPSLAMTITFVHNPHYMRKNGVSLLAARTLIGDGCLLTMADHLYSPEIVRRLRAFDLPRGSSALAVDFGIERCFDLEDATKIRVEQGRIADIGKELTSFTAIDTGVFRIGPELLEELGRIYDTHGDCSLSDGVRALAAQGRFLICDTGAARWIDVDTPAALQRAEAMIGMFGDSLGDEPQPPAGRLDADAIDHFAPAWAGAAQPF